MRGLLLQVSYTAVHARDLLHAFTDPQACALLPCHPRSVSYCTPAYYAHHAAYRARFLLRRSGYGIMDSDSHSSSSSRTPSPTVSQVPSYKQGGSSPGRGSGGPSSIGGGGGGGRSGASSSSSSVGGGRGDSGPGGSGTNSGGSSEWTMGKVHPNLLNEMYFI